MSRNILILLTTLFLFVALPALSYADGPVCTVCPSKTIRPGQVASLLGDAVHLGIGSTARAMKTGARFVGKVPDGARDQIAARSKDVQQSVRLVADKTENTLQRISAEVTTVSLQLLRSAFSYLWALLSGLWLS